MSKTLGKIFKKDVLISALVTMPCHRGRSQVSMLVTYRVGFNYVFQGLARSLLTLNCFAYKLLGKGVGRFLKNNGERQRCIHN